MKRISAYLRLAAAVAALAFITGPAYVASLTVTVKQAGTNGAGQTVTCALLQKDCDISLVLNEGAEGELPVNVHIVHFEEGLAVHFRAPGGFFYTSHTIAGTTAYDVLWNGRVKDGESATFVTTLSGPLAQRLIPVDHPSGNYTPVADIEITAAYGP